MDVLPVVADFFLGIDPGKKGAWAIVGDDGEPRVVEPLPYMGDRVNIHALKDGWEEWVKPGLRFHAVMEHPLLMPDQAGGQSAFINFGMMVGLATLMNMSIAMPMPHVWKGKMRLSKDKTMSLKLVSELWPVWRARCTGPRGGMLDGIAEALLIAEFGRRAQLRIRTPEPVRQPATAQPGLPLGSRDPGTAAFFKEALEGYE